MDPNEITSLKKAEVEINGCKNIGFDINLPTHIYRIKNNGQDVSNIQIMPKVKYTKEFKSVSNVIYSYIHNANDKKNELCLNIINNLGKQLAKFHNSKSKKSNVNYRGLQHGDFHPANILITSTKEKWKEVKIYINR